jgi:transposase
MPAGNAAVQVDFPRSKHATGKPKKVAQVACSHKLLRILNAMVRTGQAWNQEVHGLPA